MCSGWSDRVGRARDILLKTARLYLPGWARPDNPVLRAILVRGVRGRSVAQRWLLRAVALMIAGGLLFTSALGHALDQPLLLPEPLTYPALTVLYFPLVMLQYVAGMLALLLTVQAISEELDRGTWDHVLLTSHGAALVFRARWAAVFYQLRWLLLALVIPRVVAAALLVRDTARYEGQVIDQHIMGITPGVSASGAILLLAAQVTAALLVVPVGVGLCAALGLALAAVVRHKTVLGFVRIAVPVALLAGLILGLSAGSRVLDRDPLTSAYWTRDPAAHRADLFAHNVFGDLGLRGLDLTTTLRTWVDVEYGIMTGAVLLGAVIAAVILTDALVRFAAWYAARPSRR